ncbi:hypothetical protein CC80DRAFT_518300 [Byssothecium circinans]|uniref:Altered inheritance of mitochondria protein 9, mitochondrial n=1 Tax=Byssothecium circinans TaxID=147558 RepID=A0A6A5TNC5_9PLEO|nr:hypothetical protein CC80DRAFT_518300 [Byssothecium circinans]
MLQRHVRFNVEELGRRAAEAIEAHTCISIEKYPDGMYNKSMLLTMDNGSQVVAKVPNPNAGMPHFTTASEAATMEFARTLLDTPIPKVLAWNSKARENSVGAEYIIMEKAPGIELERIWPQMKIEDRLAVVKTIARFQKTWTSVSFKKFGGLYYAKDLDRTALEEPLYVNEGGVEIKDERFAIGPSTGRENFDDGRAIVDFDRGPWDTLEKYHAAIGHREIAAVKYLAQLPKSPVTLCGPGTYIPTRERKLQALDCYLKLLKFILPADSSTSSPHLWHGDLHVANIFVDPSEPTKIVSLVDWQSTEIAPLYFHARQPYIIDYDGPPVNGLERPKLLENINEMGPDAKKEAQALFYNQSLCVLYNTLTHLQNPRLYAALQFQQSPNYDLLSLARNLLIDGEMTYLALAADLKSTWHELPGAKDFPYPLSFTNEEREEIESQLQGAVLGMEAMKGIQEGIGELFPEKGLVRHDQYEEALDATAQMKEQVIEEFARCEQDRKTWEKMWPFGT